ncbi:MAG: hypothetical protein ACHP9Z_16080 [Streptosporangiales bacterium]
MSTDFERIIRLNSERIADLRKTTADIERDVAAARVSLEREFARAVRTAEESPAYFRGACQCGTDHGKAATDPGSAWVPFPAPREPSDYETRDPDCPVHSAAERTTVLLNSGRSTAGRRGLPRGGMAAIGAVVAVALVAILVMALSGGGATWPASVAQMESQIGTACRNPDVKSEPGQVNFACAKSTRQILWVFALMTSGGNAGFADPRTGRVGLEPIAPAQGGEVAGSLNLHHPYDPTNPVDSLQVAARAINDIVGGATLTGATGNPVVQPGLESDPVNCARYTGSAALSARQGFPDVCARPVTSTAGQAALVADVFSKWMVGAPATAAKDAGVLFENADNPGSPQVRAILRHLPLAGLAS